MLCSHPTRRPRLLRRDRGQQYLGVLFARVGEQLGGLLVLHGAALLYHQHVVAHLLHHGEVVRDEQVDQPQLALQLP